VGIWKESSAYQRLTDDIAHSFAVERQILDMLGEHPRIVKSVFLVFLFSIRILIHLTHATPDIVDGKISRKGYSSSKPAMATSSSTSMTMVIPYPCLSAKNGADKSLSRSHIYTAVV
jgi:hypothetical protein